MITYYVETRGYIDSDEEFEYTISEIFDSYSKALECWKKECRRVVESKTKWLKGWLDEENQVTSNFRADMRGDEKKEKPLSFYIRFYDGTPKDKLKVDHFVRIDLTVRGKAVEAPTTVETEEKPVKTTKSSTPKTSTKKAPAKKTTTKSSTKKTTIRKTSTTRKSTTKKR